MNHLILKPANQKLIRLCALVMLLAIPFNVCAKTPTAEIKSKKGKSTRNTLEIFLILCEHTTWTHEFSPNKQCELGNATSADASVAEITGTDGQAGGSVTIAAGDAGNSTLTIDLTQNAGNDINTDGSTPEQVTLKITIYVQVIPCDRYHHPTGGVPAFDSIDKFPKPAEPAKETTPTPTPTSTPKSGKQGGDQGSGGQSKGGGNKAPSSPTPTPNSGKSGSSQGSGGQPKAGGNKAPQKTPTPTPKPNAGQKVALGQPVAPDETSDGVKLATTTSPGVLTKTITIMDNGELVGEVVANLPDDPTGTFTGTVEAKPVGKNDEERSRNQTKLNEVVIQVGDQQATPLDQTFTCIVPAEAPNQPLSVIVSYKKKQIAKTSCPVPNPSTAHIATGEMPWFGQTGRNLVIPNSSDGTVHPTDSVQIGDQTMPLVVKTQQASVVRNVCTVKGLTTLVKNENGQVTSTPIQNMSVQLSADKTRLKPSEQATLKITVSGMSGITRPIALAVANNSTQIVGLRGGNTQLLNLSESDIRPDGTCSKNLTLTGKTPGVFNIKATLESPAKAATP